MNISGQMFTCKMFH